MSAKVVEAKTEASMYDFSEVVVGDFFAPDKIADTTWTPEPEFDEVKHLYIERPLFVSNVFQEASEGEDEADIKNALDSLQDTGRIRLEDFEKELGL